MAKKQAQPTEEVKEQDVAVNIPEGKDNAADKPVDKGEIQPESTKVNKQEFINKKLAVLNKKSGAMHERNAARVVKNNK